MTRAMRVVEQARLNLRELHCGNHVEGSEVILRGQRQTLEHVG